MVNPYAHHRLARRPRVSMPLGNRRGSAGGALATLRCSVEMRQTTGRHAGPRLPSCHTLWYSCSSRPVRVVTHLAPPSPRVATRTSMRPPPMLPTVWVASSSTTARHPAYVGADAHDEVQAHLVGVVAGLEALAARGDTAPLLLRLSDPAAAECVAGVWKPAAAGRLRSHLLSLLNAARAHRGHVWVAGYDGHRLHAFGERATALAAFGSMPLPGGLPSGWVPAAPPDPMWAGEDCSVCMEEFSSPWPTQDARSRAPPCRWYCPHAVCRGCEATVQGNAANSKCPLVCRALRRVHMHP